MPNMPQTSPALPRSEKLKFELDFFLESGPSDIATPPPRQHRLPPLRWSEMAGPSWVVYTNVPEALV